MQTDAEIANAPLYWASDQASLRQVAGAYLLIPLAPDARRVHTLNASGARLWQLLAEKKMSEWGLAKSLQRHYNLGAIEEALHDVRLFLDEMVELKLVFSQCVGAESEDGNE